jgi:ligand-binding SRPBCC domain-containing protein
MPVFIRSVLIAAPVEVVFAFHEREDALRLLSPPFPRVRVTERIGGIADDACVELRVGGLHWIAVHTAYAKNRYFVDEQIRGPFAVWVHRHEFAAEGSGTRLTDRIEYRLKGGRFIEPLLSWAVHQALRQMFRYRHRVTRRVCESWR